jgi:RNA polymerase sigma-70 factor (ECF subfamily)
VLEDRLLVWRLRRGNAEALCRVYDKYREDLLRLAVSLSNDAAAAEDIVHDVFISFIRGAGQFRLSGSLKAYLATCVANRAQHRTDRVQEPSAGARPAAVSDSGGRTSGSNPAKASQIAGLALLPGEQREVTLHLQAAEVS